MEPVAVIILAAGMGKRMGLDLPKVVVPTRERPMIQHVLKAAAALDPQRIIVVTGHKRELVEQSVAAGMQAGLYSATNITFAVQHEQRGTGDAVRTALPELNGFTGTVVILYGDVPLLKSQTIKNLLQHHHASKATLTILTLKSHLNFAYGRIVRSTAGQIEKIVEVRDCTPDQLMISEQNSGVYAIDSAFLEPAVTELKNDNVQKEFYLTDIVERAAKEGQIVSTLATFDTDEVQGVNTLVELAVVDKALRRIQTESLLLAGIKIEDADSLYLDPDVTVGIGSKIGPNVQLRAGTRIGKNVTIEGTAFISNSVIGDSSHIKLGVRIEDSTLDTEVSVGPFANLRAGSHLGSEVRIGNFVETKNSVLERGAKASHLTYLGDCQVGENTNIGAGTITCNYDGVNKNKTVIGANVFIGSDSCLVAPLTIEDGVYIGAGSVITKRVEKDALAFTRPPMVIKKGWAAVKRSQKKENH